MRPFSELLPVGQNVWRIPTHREDLYLEVESHAADHEHLTVFLIRLGSDSESRSEAHGHYAPRSLIPRPDLDFVGRDPLRSPASNAAIAALAAVLSDEMVGGIAFTLLTTQRPPDAGAIEMARRNVDAVMLTMPFNLLTT